jgi:hypothetical protein
MADYGRAERYYLEATAIRETVLGKEHPDYAESLNNLGTLYLEMADFRQNVESRRGIIVLKRRRGKRIFALSLYNLKIKMLIIRIGLISPVIFRHFDQLQP